MDNDRIVKLLEEIRDLQRSHVENYKAALRNQQESIEVNRAWQRRAARRSVILMILVVVMVIVVLWPWLRR